MQYFLLVLADGVLGYGLQAAACVLAIWALNGKKLTISKGLQATLLFGVIMFAIRSVPGIGFGMHTIFTLMAYIFLCGWLFKMDLYPTVLAVLLVTIGTIFFEAVTVGIWYLTLGQDTFAALMQDVVTVQGRLQRACLGLPTNILLVMLMALIYYFKGPIVKKVVHRGQSGKKNS